MTTYTGNAYTGNDYSTKSNEKVKSLLDTVIAKRNEFGRSTIDLTQNKIDWEHSDGDTVDILPSTVEVANGITEPLKLRLHAGQGQSLDTYETSHGLDWEQQPNNIKKLNKQRESLAATRNEDSWFPWTKTLPEEITNEDIYAQGEKSKELLKTKLLGQNTLELGNLKQDPTLYDGKLSKRQIADVYDSSGSNIIDSLNTPENNVDYNSRFNSLGKLKRELQQPTIGETLQDTSLNTALGGFSVLGGVKGLHALTSGVVNKPFQIAGEAIGGNTGEVVKQIGNTISTENAGKALNAIGFDPMRAKDILRESLSEAGLVSKALDTSKASYQQGQQDIEVTNPMPEDLAGKITTQGKIALDSVNNLLANPRYLATEFLPDQVALFAAMGGMQKLAAGAEMLKGASLVNGGIDAAGKITAEGMKAATAHLGSKEVMAKLSNVGAATEGALSSGMIADTAERQGKSIEEYALPAIGAGLVTGLVNKGQAKFGGGDVTTNIAARQGLDLKGLVTTPIKEGVEETLQSPGEEIATNIINKEEDILKNTGRAAGEGFVGGAVMGAEMHGIGLAAQTPSKLSEALQTRKTSSVEPIPTEAVDVPKTGDLTPSKPSIDEYKAKVETITDDNRQEVINQGIKDYPIDGTLPEKIQMATAIGKARDGYDSPEHDAIYRQINAEIQLQNFAKGMPNFNDVISDPNTSIEDIQDNLITGTSDSTSTNTGSLFNDIGRTKDPETLDILKGISSAKQKEYADSDKYNDPYVLATTGIETKNLPKESSEVFSAITRDDYEDLNMGLNLLSSHVKSAITPEQKNTGISALTKTISKVYSDKVDITPATERTVKQALNTINGLVTNKGTITIEPSDSLEEIHRKILPTFGSTMIEGDTSKLSPEFVKSNNELVTALKEHEAKYLKGKSTEEVANDKLVGGGKLPSYKEHLGLIQLALSNNIDKEFIQTKIDKLAKWVDYDSGRAKLFNKLANATTVADRTVYTEQLQEYQKDGNPFTENDSLKFTSINGTKKLSEQVNSESKIMTDALANIQNQVNAHFGITPEVTPTTKSTPQTDEDAPDSTNVNVEQIVKDYLDKTFKNVNPKLTKALSDIIKTNSDNTNLELDVEKFLHGFNKGVGLETDPMYQKGLHARNSTQGKKLQLLNKVSKPSKTKESFYDTHTLLQVIAKLGGLTEESVNEISDKGKSGRWFKKANTKSKIQPMSLQEMVEALQAVHFTQITDSKELLKYIENEIRGVSEDLARSDRGHELYAEQELSDEFDFQTQQYILKVEQLLNDLENTPWLLEVLNKLGNKEDIDIDYYQDLINENNSRTEETSRTGSTEEIPTKATPTVVESSTSNEISKSEEDTTSEDKTSVIATTESSEVSLDNEHTQDLLEVPLPSEDIKNYSELINRTYFPFSTENQLKSIRMFFFANALKSKIPEAKTRFLYLQELATNNKDIVNETFDLPIWRFDTIRPYSLTHKWKEGKLVSKTREVTTSLSDKTKKFFSDLFNIKDDNLFSRIPNLLEHIQQNKLINNNSLSVITKFHNDFVKVFEANNNPFLLKESLSDNAASSLFIYDPKKGKTYLEPNALFAMSLGSIQYLQTALSTVYNDDNAIRSIVGLKEGDNLPAYIRDLLSDKGSVANIMKNQLGASLSKLMGVTYKPEATIPQIEGFEASLGAYALRTLIDMKLLEETQIEKTTINAMKNQLEEGTLPGNQKTQDITDKLYIGATTFARVAAQKNIETGRPEVKPEIKELLEAIKPAIKELDNLLNTSFSEAMPSGNKTSLKVLKKWLGKTWQGSNAEYSEAEYKALKKYNDTAYTAETKAMNAALVLDEEFIKQIALGERYTDVVQKHFEKTRSGKELQADNEYKYLMDSFDVFKEHGSLYFLSKLWKQGRVGMEKGPQNSKMMRWLFAPKGVEYEVDLSNKESSKFFKLAVVAAFGTKIDQISETALDEKFDALLETYKDVLKDYSKTKGYTENVTQEMKDTLLDAVYAGKEGFHSYAGLLELAHYNENKDKGKFTSQLMREDDGITNGPAIGWLLFNGGGKEQHKNVLDGFAIFTDSHEDTFTSHMAKEGSADNYNLMAQKAKENQVIVNAKLNELNTYLSENPSIRSSIFRIRYYDKKNNTDSFNTWFYEQGLGDMFDTNSYEFGLLLDVIEESKTLTDTNEGKKKANYKENLQPTLNAIHSMVGELNRSFAKMPLMTLIFGSGINKIASNIGYIAIDSMYEKIQKIVRSKPKNQEEIDKQRELLKEIEDNIIELTGYNIPLPLNEDKEEDASLYSNEVAEDYDSTLAAYSNEALKNFKLPTYVEKKLAKQIANVYVPIIRASVTANFQTFIDNRKAINQIYDIGNTVLKTYIEHEVSLTLKDGLTKQKLLDIFEKAVKLMPSMKVPNFDGTEREIFYWNKDESSSTMPEFKVQVKRKKNKEILSFSYLDDKGEVHTSKPVTLNSSTDTGHAVGILLEAIGVRTPIMTIHYTDSLPVKDIMLSNLISLMVHDARLAAANTSDEGSYLMNKKLLESINLLNPFKQATDYLQQVFDNLPKGDSDLTGKLKNALENPLKKAFKNKQTVPHVQQGKRKVSPLIYNKENSGKQFKDYLGYLNEWVKYQTGVKNEIAKSIKAFGNYGGNATFKPQMVEAVKQDNFRELVAEEFKDILKNNSLEKGNKPLNDITDKLVNLYTQVNVIETLQEFIDRVDTLGLTIEQFKQHQTNIENKILGISTQETKPSESNKEKVTTITTQSNEDNKSLGSTPNAKDLLTEVEDLKKDVTAENIVSEFDAMPKGEDETHNTFLRNFVSQVIAPVVEATELLLFSKATYTYGQYSAELNKVAINLGQAMSKDLDKFQMSAQEVFVHEFTHAVTWAAYSLYDNKHIRNIVDTLFYKLEHEFNKYKARNKDDKSLDKWDGYVFNNKDFIDVTVRNTTTGKPMVVKYNRGIQEFLAFGSTNKEFRELLTKLKPRQLKVTEVSASTVSDEVREATWIEVISNVLKKVLDSFIRLAKGKDSLDPLIMFDKNVRLILAANGKTGYLNTTVPIVDRGDAFISEKTKDAGLGVLKFIAKGRRSKIQIINSLGKYANTLPVIGGFETNKVIRETIKLIKHEPTRNLLLDMVNDIKGTTEANKPLENAILNQDTIEGERNTATAKDVQEYQKKVGVLNDLQDTAFKNVVLSGELFSVRDNYPTNFIKLLEDKSELNQEIRSLEVQIPKLISDTKNLASMMVLGKYTETGLGKHNAALVAKQGRNIPQDMYQKEIDLVTKLSRLYAIGLQDVNHVNEVVKLLKDKPQAMNEIMNVHRENVRKAHEEGHALTIHDGEIPTSNNPFRSIHLGTKEDEKFLVENWGATIIGNLERDPNDPLTTPGVLYLITEKTQQDYDSKAMAFVSRNSESSNFHSGFVMTDRFKAAENREKAKLKDDGTKSTNDIKQKNNSNVSRVAIFNQQGKVIRYEYVLDRATKDKYLKPTVNAFKDLATQKNAITYINEATKLNNQLVDKLYNYWKELGHKARKDMIWVGSEGKYKDLWNMIPTETKTYFETKFGTTKGFYMAEEELRTVFGYRKQTITNWIQPVLEDDLKRHIGNHIYYMAKRLGFNLATITAMESMWIEGISFAKDTIVVKSGVVSAANESSNFMTAKLEGMPIPFYYENKIRAMKAEQQFRRDSDALLSHLSNAYGNPEYLTDAINHEMEKLKSAISNNPMAFLHEEGLASTIAEENAHKDKHETKLYSKTERARNLFDKLPKVVKDTLKVATISEGTKIYTLMNEIAQMGDITSRFALIAWEAEKAKRSGTKFDYESAIDKAKFLFIQYHSVTNDKVQWGNDIGLIMFSKFGTKAIGVLAHMFGNHAGRLLALGILEDVLGTSDWIWNTSLNKFAIPTSSLYAAIDASLIANALITPPSYIPKELFSKLGILPVVSGL